MDELTADLLRYLMNPKSQAAGDNRLFARLAGRPVLRLGTVWIFSRYDLVTRLAGDPRCVLRLPDQWAELPDLDPAIAGIVDRLMPTLPPADHRRLRRLLAGEFRARTIDRLHGAVTRIVDELFTAASATGECDFVADICGPLPVFTTAALLGIPDRDRERVLTWTRTLNGSIIAEFGRLSTWPGAPGTTPAPSPGTASGLAEVIGYIERLVRRRQRDPRDDLVSRLITQADSPDGRLTHDELVALVAMLFMTGIDTVGSGLANVIMALHRTPEIWRRVVADRDLARDAFVEGTRLHPALPVVSRLVDADIELGDTVVPAGSTVLLMYGAANLDGTVFPDPETFDLSRNPNNHLGFGHGPHYCLGASLAIMQGEAVLRALAERAPDFDIVAGHGERRRELAFHSVTELRLRLRPAHTGLLV